MRRRQDVPGAAVRRSVPLAAWLLLAIIAVTCGSQPRAFCAEAATGGSSLDCSPESAGQALAGLRFGFKAGLGASQHTGTEERDAEYRVSSHWRTGVAAACFLRFSVTSRLAMQQEVSYAQKGSRQDISVEILEIPTILDVTYDMDYVEIATLLRFAWLKWDSREIYSLAGTALCLKVHDRYALSGEVSDGEQTVPVRADADMSEVDMFDYCFVYGTGLEFSAAGLRMLVEYRFTIGWNTLAMPTYAYVPFGEEWILIDNPPVPLKNQSHLIQFGLSF